MVKSIHATFFFISQPLAHVTQHDFGTFNKSRSSMLSESPSLYAFRASVAAGRGQVVHRLTNSLLKYDVADNM
jgi:hypothetical protein